MQGCKLIFSPERTYVLLRHHLGWTKQNCGRTLPKLIKIVRLNHGRYLFIVAVKWFTIKYLSGHHVRPHLGFRRTWAKFGRPISDDRQLFAALSCYWNRDKHWWATWLVNRLNLKHINVRCFSRLSAAMISCDTKSLTWYIKNGYGKYLIISFWFTSATYQLICFRHGYFSWQCHVRIQNMAQQNSPDMMLKHTKGV